MKNFYHILGVEQNASREDIKSAYRKLQLKFHSDKNQDNPDPFYEERSKDVNAAHENLIDPNKRAKHNQVLEKQGKPKIITRTQYVESKKFNFGNFALGAIAAFLLINLFKSGKE